MYIQTTAIYIAYYTYIVSPVIEFFCVRQKSLHKCFYARPKIANKQQMLRNPKSKKKHIVAQLNYAYQFHYD